ncbi:MAG: hypothetical protein AAGC55_19810, partial [Myxococcota bacterium]
MRFAQLATHLARWSTAYCLIWTLGCGDNINPADPDGGITPLPDAGEETDSGGGEGDGGETDSGPGDGGSDAGPSTLVDCEVAIQTINSANGLRSENMMFNPVLANPSANQALLECPLTDATFSGEGCAANSYDIGAQLSDPWSQQLMSYIVGCALEPGQSINWTDPTSSKSYTWSGVSGLCQRWADGAADAECQEMVTSCVLARNNASGTKVPLSMRGVLGTDSFGLSDQVPGFTGNAEDFSGDSPGVVGVCQPGTTIDLTPDAATCAGGTLRVCDGRDVCTGAA